MNIKNEVLARVYLVLFIVIALGIIIFSKAIYISKVEGNKWRSMGDSLYVRMVNVEAQRGSILADDGGILATSLPNFDIRMDMNSTGLTDLIFKNGVDSLAYCLSRMKGAEMDFSGYKNFLFTKRKAADRYVMIRKSATYEDLELIKNFPIFRLGKNKGGLIVERKNIRERPFNLLARRTIGYIREGTQPIGLEGYYNSILEGHAGKQLMQKVSNDAWIPVNDMTSVEPKSGDDIKTTLNINMQEIAHNALQESLETYDGKHGCAIIMDVKTGAIKAMVNLGKENGEWVENYNYAIGMSSEPGSTFKAASMMAMLEDGLISLKDTVHLQQGSTKYCNVELVDAEKHKLGKVTVKEAFEESSNVGISKLVTSVFGERNNAEKFIRHLRDFNLHLPTGIELDGEAAPLIKDAFNQEQGWSCTSLPWMSIGYEVKITPLQILNFYNAIANNGQLMKPYLISEIQKFDKTIKVFNPIILKKKIASTKTINAMKELLEGVVESGTMKEYKSPLYNYAGKTGTAQLDYKRSETSSEIGGHQASFVGYFPAENPKYSCIVVVVDPKRGSFYGSTVAGSAFRKIADNCYASIAGLQTYITKNTPKKMELAALPSLSAGKGEELKTVLDKINYKYQTNKIEDYGAIVAQKDSIKLVSREITKNKVPNVIGMGLKDALFLLENKGMKVEIRGIGKVTEQSVPAGTIAKGQYVTLHLN